MWRKRKMRAWKVWAALLAIMVAAIAMVGCGGTADQPDDGETGGATLTMEKKIGNTIVVFLAEFERDQEEALKNIKVGDEITFEGTCYSAGSWSDCELVN
ncbi:MAG: hypothetical protein [Bacteriophage sp.]|nr:MAG: hypothetical protein [Bacteriophage sp.]